MQHTGAAGHGLEKAFRFRAEQKESGTWMLSEGQASDWSAVSQVRGKLNPDIKQSKGEIRNLKLRELALSNRLLPGKAIRSSVQAS